MRCEIISIGDELLIGQVVNTNATWMGQALNEIGIMVDTVLTIGDTEENIRQSMKLAIKHSQIILITGGLGPTKDDITKHTLAKLFDCELVENKDVMQANERMFAAKGYPMTPINRRQAYVPDCCEVIMNTCGTAPGMWFNRDGTIIISMPGVPYEMKKMMELDILPRLKALTGGEYILHQNIMTHGLGESFLSDKIATWEDALPQGFKLAYLPEPGILRLRLTAIGKDEKRLREKMEKEVSALSAFIPEYIYAYKDQTLQQSVLDILETEGYTLSTAESCTGGNIAHLITSIAGSSKVFKGGIVAYSNEIKQNLLGVKAETLATYGAVSRQTVIEMAEGARERFGSDYAISVSGIAGPTGGTEEKPVGSVWIAVSAGDETKTELFNFGDNRERNIIRASYAALNMLRMMCKGKK